MVNRAAPVALVLLVLSLPGVAAQHQHGGDGLWLLHELDDDIEPYAGKMTTFTALVVGDDGRPTFHTDVEVEVWWNGVLMLSMAPPASHDYDGAVSFGVTFPGPGPYEVKAKRPSAEHWTVLAGNVTRPAPEPHALAFLEAPGSADGAAVPFTFLLTNETGARPHADAMVQVRDARGAVVLQTQTHTHSDPMSFDYRFPASGIYDVTVSAHNAYVGGLSVPFEPLAITTRVEATAPPLAGAPFVPSGLPVNAVTASEGGDHTLFVLYDPFTSVGVGQVMRIGAVVLGPDGVPARHVDMEVAITDPVGPLFASSSLHEHDGFLEILTASPVVGEHLVTVTASTGDWTGTAQGSYTVTPVPIPPLVGPPVVRADGVPTAACQEAPIDFAIVDLLGAPYAHGEVTYSTHAGDVVTGFGKLHTHGEGTTAVRLAQAAGDFTLRGQAQGTTPALLGPGAPGTTPFEIAGVVQGECPEWLPAMLPAQAVQETPFPAAAGLALLVAWALARRK